MKGLFEWKLLAAIFAVLIVASSAMISNMGIKDMFLNSTGEIGDWINSPFGSLFSTPKKTTNFIAIELYADAITLEMTDSVNITSVESSIDNFKGTLVFDFNHNRTYMIPEGTDLKMDVKLTETVIEDVRIANLVLEDVSYVVKNANTNITADDERIEIHEFIGTLRTGDGVILEGNVSSVKNGQWSIG